MSTHLTPHEYANIGNKLGAEVAAFVSQASYDPIEETKLRKKLVSPKNYGTH